MKLTDAERAAWDAAAAQEGQMLARKHVRTIRQAYIPRMTPQEYYSRHERRDRLTWQDWAFAAGIIAVLSVAISIMEGL